MGNIKLGQHTLTSPLIQGPLAGFSHSVYRSLICLFGGIGYGTSEMISSQTIIQRSRNFHRLTQRAKNEKILCYQLAGAHPSEVHEAVAILCDLGADIIDLNCGCPMPKIRKKGQGSKLLSSPEHLAKMIAAMRQATDKTISIKIRVDGESSDHHNLDMIAMINESDIDFCIVHGRHWQDDYHTACHYDQISEFVDSLKKPVVGNGDVSDIASLQKIMDTGCCAVMISRGAMGRPWVFTQLQHQLQQKPYQCPNSYQIIELCQQHITGIAQLYQSETMALHQARKICRYYAKHVPHWVFDMQSLISITSLNGLNYYFHQLKEQLLIAT